MLYKASIILTVKPGKDTTTATTTKQTNKQTNIQTKISDEHRLKNPPKNNYNLNTNIHQNDYLPLLSWFYPEDTVRVKHVQVNKCNK